MLHALYQAFHLPSLFYFLKTTLTYLSCLTITFDIYQNNVYVRLWFIVGGIHVKKVAGTCISECEDIVLYFSKFFVLSQGQLFKKSQQAARLAAICGKKQDVRTHVIIPIHSELVRLFMIVLLCGLLYYDNKDLTHSSDHDHLLKLSSTVETKNRALNHF